MAETKTKTKSKPKYVYAKRLEGCGVGSKGRTIVLNDKVSQNDLAELHELGVNGIVKAN